ncbi:MAG: TIGR00730 family Rossman fold protein [Candidatus Omnitrophica bacterium]|nr:TIGR00730 family Rossman fold protein [Candidatus Omnitrophota bacterium]
MSQTDKTKRNYSVGIRPIDRTIARLTRMTGDVRNHDLVSQLMTTVAKIGREKLSRGDLKVINTTLKELRYTFKVFKPYRTIRKVAVFGSARTKESAEIYKSAQDFGRHMVQNDWMIITGGSSGIMRAAQEGAGRTRSFGLNILLPFEQNVNPTIEGDKKLIHFKYFFTRKLAFIKESDATVLYPGGFGTHDEGMESLTLSQTGKNNPRPIVLVDTPRGNYWAAWFRFVEQYLLNKKLIDPDDYLLPTLVRDPKEACQIVLDFYRTYHSLRYVGNQTVIRLKHEISNDHLKRLNRYFSSIVTGGKVEKTNPLPVESDEPELHNLPRLKMNFDRKSYGKLKRFIVYLNEG